MIEIRRATAADGEAIGLVHAASWEAAYAPFFEEGFAAREIASRLTRWHDRVADPTGLVLLAAVDGRALAFSWSVPSAQSAETGATTTRDFGDGNPLPQVEYERDL